MNIARRLYGSGWARLFLVLWIPWAAWLGWRMNDTVAHRSSMLGLLGVKYELEALFQERGRHADLESVRLSIAKEEAVLDELTARGDTAFHFYAWGLAAPPVVALALLWVFRGFRRRSVASSGAQAPAEIVAPARRYHSEPGEGGVSPQ
jgi:hypothetical protein